MASVIRVCRKCGAKIFSDAPEGLCTGCVLETALGILPGTVAGGAGCGSGEHAQTRNGNAASDVKSTSKAFGAKLLGELGAYELFEEVGRGGQGVVFCARQKALNRIVALKVIGLGQWATKAHLRRFRLEAEAAASLDHPHIVPIYEVGERDGQCYFSMKFIEGGQLDEVVSHSPMSIRNAVELIAKVARTVHYAHEHGILHRDIKPGNILLDSKGEPQLTDFGLARLVESESTVTRTVEVLGTPSYMAPEQAAAGNNTKLTRATDVYGLGAVFYQLLTGHPPFAGGTTYETIKLLLETEPRPPRLWNPKVDHDLSTICSKCLEKDPQCRYSSALALAEDLEHWLKHEPIQARPTGAFARGKKWVRRNPAVAALTTSLVALAAAMGWNVWKSELVSGPAIRSVAVLPFENLSRDPDNAYFADGIQEEILTRLAKIADLKVISRTSTQRYQSQSKPRNLGEIAKQLGVANIVEGSVQKAVDQVRVNVQLVNAQTDSHLWADTYDRKLTDPFGVESEIAKGIAESLQVKLTGREEQALAVKPTQNPAAYDAYLRGLSLEHNEYSFGTDLQAATDYAEAVRLDPNFALAWARLASVRSFLYFNGIEPNTNTAAAVKEAADRAMAVAPEAGESWIAQGFYRYRVRRDFAGALAAYQEAQKRLPNSALVYEFMAVVQRRLGRWQDAETNYKKAIKLDPRDIQLLASTGEEFYNYLRRFDEALALLNRALEISPDSESCRAEKAIVLQSAGRLSEAAQELARIPANSTDFWVVSVRISQALYERQYDAAIQLAERMLNATVPGQPVDTFAMVNAGYCYTWTGRPDEARRAFTRVINELKPTPDTVVPVDGNSSPILAAQAYAGLAEKENALKEARQAVKDYETDAIGKAAIEIVLAQIQAQLGDFDAAIAALPHLLEVPAGLTTADLKFNPFWDPLRSDPRFQKLCEEKKP